MKAYAFLPLLALLAGCACPSVEPTSLLVRDANNRPVRNVTVSWSDQWGERHGFACVDKAASGTAQTGANGEAVLPPLSPGRHRRVEIVVPSAPVQP